MGSCFSKELNKNSPTCSTQNWIGKIRYDENCNDEKDDIFADGDQGAQVRIEGNSSVASMFTQKGMKGINQDAMTVWENFNGENDVLFCGIFDGHGPWGHTIARHIRDTLPSKLSSAFRQSQLINGCNHSDLGIDEEEENDGSSYNTKESHENTSNHNSVLSTWASSFLESFKETDDELACNRTIDSYCSGTTAVTDVQRLWLPDHDDMGLAMSRAFGDFCLKRCGLIAVPEVSYRKLTDRDEFVILASDGVSDSSYSEVIQIVASATKRSLAAKLLVEKAVRAWRYRFPGSRTDDCAVVCLFLKKPLPRPSKTSTLESASSWTIDSWHSCRASDVIGEPSGKIIMTDSKDEYTALDGGARVNSILSIPRFSLRKARRP